MLKNKMKILNIKPKKYLEQGIRYCGGYTIKAVLSAYGLDDGREPEKYLPSLKKSLGFTTPNIIKRVLKEYGLKATIKRVHTFSDAKKIKIKKTLSISHTKVCGLLGFLDDPKSKTLKLRPHSKECGFRFMDIIKKELDKNHSVILLIGNGYSKQGKYSWLRQELIAHWISVWGYNDKEKVFYIYDSYARKKDNVPIGNVKRTYQQLLRDWKGAFYTKGYLYITIRRD